MNGKHVVFGEVKQGMDVLQAMERVGTDSGSPSETVMIEACGELRPQQLQQGRPAAASSTVGSGGEAGGGASGSDARAKKLALLAKMKWKKN